jgi:predicted permease
VVPERPLWTRLLWRVVAFRARDAEVGDVLEEYGAGTRSPVWLVRQICSLSRRHRSHITIDERRAEMLSNFWSDIRYAIRTLGRNPAFAVAAVTPLALGIGINTGLFSILNSVALRPLPTPASNELVSVYQDFHGIKERRVHGARSMFSIPEYRTYRDAAKTLSGVMAYSRSWTITLGGGSPREIEGVLVTCNYFDVLRVRTALGAGFTAANCDASAATPAVILSHALWTRDFAADPDVVRKTVVLNGQNVAVVGVAPEGFDGIDITKAALFVPASLQRVLLPTESLYEDANLSWLTLVGRRHGGSSLERVRAELGVIAGQIDQQQPGRTTRLIVAPATSLSLPVARRDIFSVATIVLVAFGLVLLIACANVANLLLARGSARTQEIAVRLSVGASRGRLIQQLLTESAIIALAGGAAGSLLAWWSFQALLAWLFASLPGTIPELRIDARPNLTVFWFALALTAAAALVFGLLPALQASRPDVYAAMKQDGSGSGGRGGRRKWRFGTPGGSWLRGMLVGLQVAVCMVLLISAALLMRALYAAQTIEPDFQYRNVAVVSFSLSGRDYDTDAKVAAFQQRLFERIAALPGVDDVAQLSKVPLSPGRHQTMFRLPGQDQWHETNMNTVSPSYFGLMAIPIVRGRSFAAAELVDSSRAAIITEATARRYWPSADPIGRTLVMSLGPNAEVTLEIIGVAKDAQVSQLAAIDSSLLYLPASPNSQRGLRLVVRGPADFGALATSVRSVARELDSGLVVRVNRLEENLDFWRTGSRLIAGLSGTISVLALVLASVGVYGVVSYIVTRRRREVGIRMTLGATRRDVQRLFLRQTLRPVLIGSVLGIAGAAVVSRVLESVLFGISPYDPIAFVGAPLVLLGVAATASFLPTRAALEVDPMVTLRYE